MLKNFKRATELKIGETNVNVKPKSTVVLNQYFHGRVQSKELIKSLETVYLIFELLLGTFYVLPIYFHLNVRYKMSDSNFVKRVNNRRKHLLEGCDYQMLYVSVSSCT